MANPVLLGDAVLWVAEQSVRKVTLVDEDLVFVRRGNGEPDDGQVVGLLSSAITDPVPEVRRRPAPVHGIEHEQERPVGGQLRK